MTDATRLQAEIERLATGLLKLATGDDAIHNAVVAVTPTPDAASTPPPPPARPATTATGR